MTRKQALIKLKKLLLIQDPEFTHGEADDVLIAFIRAQGFDDVADAWEKVDKWYS